MPLEREERERDVEREMRNGRQGERNMSGPGIKREGNSQCKIRKNPGTKSEAWEVHGKQTWLSEVAINELMYLE